MALTKSDVQLDEISRLRMQIAAGMRVRNVADPRMQRALDVARATGAPILPVLSATTDALIDDAELQRTVRVMSAQGRGIMIAMSILPYVVLLLMDRYTDYGVIEYYRGFPGLFFLGIAVCMQLAGIAWARRSIKRARESAERGLGKTAFLVVFLAAAVALGTVQALIVGAVLLAVVGVKQDPPTEFSDEIVELVAAGLDGGLTHAAALRSAATHCPVDALDSAGRLRKIALAMDLGRELPTTRLSDALVLARRTGAPVSEVLRALATDLRAEQLARALEAANRLPTQLIYPVTSLMLPSLLLLAIAPMAASILGSLDFGW